MARVKEPHVCPECGMRYWNAGAHAERCTGRPLRQPVERPWDWDKERREDEADRRRVEPHLTGGIDEREP